MTASSSLFRNRAATFCVLLSALILVSGRCASGQSSPSQLVWGVGGNGGSGTWDTTTADWFDGTGNVPWTNGDNALFGGTAGTVSINGAVTAAQVTFSTPGYVVQNFFLNGAASGLTVQTDADATISSSVYGAAPYNTAFTKTGAGVLTFTGQGPVFFGTANVNAGEVRFVGTGSPNFTTPYVLADAPGVALTFASTFNQIASLGGGGSGTGASGAVVRPNITSGSLTLAIYGSGNATFGGVIQDNGNAVLAFQKSGGSTQTLRGVNTYSGATYVSGGTLALAGANGSLSNTASISVSTGGTLLLDNTEAASTTRLPGSVPVSLSGGTLSLTGNATAGSKQSVGTLSFSRASTVTSTPVGTVEARLDLFGGISRQNNGTLSFTDGGNYTVTGLTTLNGIAAPYLTVGGTNWATVDANGNVSAYAAYVTDPAASNGQSNLRLVTSTSGTTTLGRATTSFNSLNLVNSGSTTATLDLGQGQTLNLTSGGLLTSGSAGHVIQNGTLVPGGNELIVTNQAVLTIASTLANGGSAPTATTLTKSGAGTLTLLGNNTYTGATVINQGTLQAGTDANLGAGSVIALNGGTLQATGSFTSAKSFQGSGGTVDTNGYNVAFSGGNNTIGVTKNGAGMLTLTGAVPSASVNAGVLRLTNLATGNAASINLFGGRVEASGSGVRRIESFGTVTPPEISPGAIGQAATLTLGSLAVTGSTVIDFDLGSTATDALTIATNLSLNGGNNPQLLFRFADLGGTRTGTAYPLLNLPASGSPLSVTSFGVDPASTAAGYRGTFTLANNALSITFSAVPEPGACLWLCGGLGIGMFWMRVARKQRTGKPAR